MKTETFDKEWFKDSKTLRGSSSKYTKGVTGGGVTIVGGSKLFHGAPLIALKAASRIVSMVYFASPSEDKSVADKIKSSLLNFIWVPYTDVDRYVAKSEAALVGPGMMRSHVSEHGFVCDTEGEQTRKISLGLFEKNPDQKWVVDGGTLQVTKVSDLPGGAVVSPNKKEFTMLFGEEMSSNLDERAEQIFRLAKQHNLVILTKDEVSIVSDGKRVVKITGGNEGLVKGCTGDLIAGIIVGFLAKDDGLFASAAASYLTKKAAEKLAEKRGFMFNADDLTDMVPEIYGEVVANL
ncbi:MAG: Sugar kinase [uncultured bacterium]|nr:MAG: Sugar kinase [uncultured bacterium]